MTFRPTSMVARVLIALALALAPPAFAQGKPSPPERAEPVSQRVDVELMVVHATNAHSRVDSRLRALLPHLRHLNYTGFDVLEVRRDDLSPAQETTFSIAGDRRMKLQLLEVDERQAKLRVRMYNQQGRLLDTTVSIHRNRSFIVAGPQHDGGVLILPVTARY